jgi:UDP-glucose 4-epimerase
LKRESDIIGHRESARVLVVGMGFVGEAVARHLTNVGKRVRALSRSTRETVGGIEWIAGDACAPGLIERAVESVDTVVWCAGRMLPSSTIQSLAEFDDLSPLVTLLRRLSCSPQTRLIFLSSGGTVYGPQAPRPTSETQPVMPESLYAAVKVRGERWIESFRSDVGLDAVVLRCANIYGPGQKSRRPQGIVAHAFDCIVEQRPLALFADEASTRDYVFIDDVMQVITACGDRENVPTVMNVGSGRATKLGDLLEMVRQIAGGLAVSHRPSRGTDMDHSELDISRLREFLPEFEPTDLFTGLTATWRAWTTRTQSSS